ncbi:MAG: glycosyltransferase family 39 protein [Acidobacteria bacterium]|nr:glycosyltransferase family 39 protein [Acidobacteriota bacterium]
MNPRRRAAWLLLLAGLLHTGVNLLWLSRDTRPWIWDMAFQARMGLDWLDWARHPSLEKLQEIDRTSMQYPPLYPWAEAAGYAIAGKSADAAALPNFLFLGLMLWAVFRIGERLGGVSMGLWASVLTSFFPILVWLSRTPLVDFSLTALVCVAIHFLLETENFQRPGRCLLFGVTCGIGMLDKWSFLFFVAGPALYVCLEKRSWRQRCCLRNLLLGTAVAVLIASVWYAPKFSYLLFDYLPRHAAEGAAEGDPPLLSAVAWIYYLEFLLSYQLFMPLALPLGAGIYWAVRRLRHIRSLAVVCVWLSSSWFLLSLFRNKDPRYTVPLLPGIALLAAAGLVTEGPWRSAARWAALGIASLQFLAITSPVSLLPAKVSLGPFHGGTYLWEWQVFSRTYAGFLGPARSETWPIDDVLLSVVAEGGKVLYVIPDHPYFSPETFSYQARLRQRPVEILGLRAGRLPGGEGGFILGKTGQQGDLRTSVHARRLTDEAKSNPAFHLVRTFSLPDGSEALLFGPGG